MFCYVVKKLSLMLMCLSLMSCGQQEYVKTNNGTSARKIDSEEITEMCYQGVVYVRFGSPEFSWGSVKYNPNGKIVTCVPEVSPIVKTVPNKK